MLSVETNGDAHMTRRLAALVLFLLPAAVGAQDLTRKNYERVLDHVQPDRSECRWEVIPWRPTFFEAVVEAHAKDRPILLWAMNGHPLGCT